MSKKSLLLISLTSLRNAPRPQKQILALRDYFSITEVALAPSPYAERFIQLTDIPKSTPWQKVIRLFHLLRGDMHPYNARYAWPFEKELSQEHFDLVIVHDIDLAPFAFRIAGKAPVLYDLHEYLPRQYENDWRWRLLFQRGIYGLCRDYLPRGRAWLTVSEPIAEEYAREFGIHPQVTYNAPMYCALEPSPVTPSRIRLVHHGSCAKGRLLENMLELMQRLDERFELHLYLVGEGEHYEQFKRRAQSIPRVVWHDPVPMPKIAREINQYDIGLFMLPANTFNHDQAMPNKLFEFIQGRLLAAVWPTKGMKCIIDAYKTGFYTADFSVEEMASRLMALTTEEIAAFKRNSHAAARILTGERSVEKIRELALSLVESSGQGVGRLPNNP